MSALPKRLARWVATMLAGALTGCGQLAPISSTLALDATAPDPHYGLLANDQACFGQSQAVFTRITAKGRRDFPFEVASSMAEPTFQFDGTVNLANIREVWAGPRELKPGLYKATGKIMLTGTKITGRVTFLAPQILIHGKEIGLKPFAKNVLAVTYGRAQTIRISGNSGRYAGLLCSPKGLIALEGNDNAIEGAVMADTFRQAGSGNRVTFRDPGSCQRVDPASPTAMLSLADVGTFVPAAADAASGSCQNSWQASTIWRGPRIWRGRHDGGRGIGLDAAGNLYFATGDYRLARMATDGRVTVVAGNGSQVTKDGYAASAAFDQIGDIRVDSRGMVYLTDAGLRLRRFDPSTHQVKTIAENLGDASAFTLEPTGRYAYVAEAGTRTIDRIDLASGLVECIAGNRGSTGWTDGPANQARFGQPAGIALDKQGNLFVSDARNHCIRKIDLAAPAQPLVSTVAGDPNQFHLLQGNAVVAGGFADGPARSARFNGPTGIAFDEAGNLLVADRYNQRIRRIDPSVPGQMMVSTVAGNKLSGEVNAMGTASRLEEPTHLAVSGCQVYVTDGTFRRIRQLK